MTKEFIKLVLLQNSKDIKNDGDGTFLLNIKLPYDSKRKKSIKEGMIEIRFSLGMLEITALDEETEDMLILKSFSTKEFQNVAEFMLEKNILPKEIK